VAQTTEIDKALDFERPLIELEARIEALRRSGRPGIDAEARRLEERLQRLQRKVFGKLTAWQRVQLARHPRRPYVLDLIPLLTEDFVELHGDRLFGDDRAIVGGLARLEGRPIVVVGHQKGRDTEEKLHRNFGMPHPEGYRKALRLMQLAERFRKPVLTLIDTPGAYPGVGAEERGQAEAIARNLREMAGLETPIVAVVTGEGGSGGALALAVADRVLMLEHAIYSVISPEGCAAILWEDAGRAKDAAEVLRITAPDLLKLGVVDGVILEPPGGAHRNWPAAAQAIREVVAAAFAELVPLSPGELVQQRYGKFRRIGIFEETS
jgi:acetyl-CoA carboxylase carboxyl transferase subunit alpha